MEANLEELRRLHAEAVKSWAIFESSIDPSDQSRRVLPKWCCVRERIEKIGDALAGRSSFRSLDFIDSLADMRGLYWDNPATPREERGLKDAAALFMGIYRAFGSRKDS
jgi:hypothetical protein